MPSFTVSATGDILPHSPLWEQAARNAGGVGRDFAPMFAGVAPLLASADLAICHLETPIAPAGEALSTAPLYGVPVEIATAIAGAGYDRCSTASNHSLDRGRAGIDRTIGALEAAGVAQSGTARTPSEAQPGVFRVQGVVVSHLSYSYGFNGLPLPAGEPWRANLIEPGRIVADAANARRQGAEVVIVSLHWGEERVRTPTAEQRRVAEAVTASGMVDLIVGHHAHVLQPIERVNGVWVVYGMGNVLSNHRLSQWWPADAQDGAIVSVRITLTGTGAGPGATRVDVSRPSVRPTWVDLDDGWVIRDVLADLSDPATDAGQRRELESSLARTASVLGAFM
jgi:poly-gamma-glutamate synthesis protein (capsule biosynthesis protein)